MHKDVPMDMVQAIGIDVAQLKISIIENNLFLAISRARLFELSVRKSYNETKQNIEESIRYYKAIVDFCKEIDVQESLDLKSPYVNSLTMSNVPSALQMAMAGC